MMYEKLNVPCLGIIENMSYYICPHCGTREEIFDHGGARLAAEELGAAFLGEIPLNAKLRLFADQGTPEKSFTAVDDTVRSAIRSVVQAVAGQISVRVSREEPQPTLSVE